MNFRWLQLSDIHFAYKNYPTNRMRQNLFVKLKQLNDMNESNKINAILITGDVTNKCCEYSSNLTLFVNELLATLNLSKDQLFIVPGNHDFNRAALTDELNGYIEHFDFDKSMSASNTDILPLFEAQKDYYNWYEALKKEALPKHEIHYVKSLEHYKIIHINTAWLSFEGVKEGQLYIGINQLHETLKNGDLRPEDLNIAIGHHSLDWLAEEEKIEVRSLFRDYNIDFYLSGHVHNSAVLYDSHIDTCYCTCRQTRSDMFDTGGFILGNINTENGNNYLEFWAWKPRGSYWSVDGDVGLEAPTGTYLINTAKYSSKNITDAPIIVVHKCMGPPLNTKKLISDHGFDINTPIFQYPHFNIKGLFDEQWLDHKEDTKNFIRGFILRLGDNTAHMFPLSPIPLLIQAGYELQNNTKMNIYQLNEELEWVLDSGDAEEIELHSVFQKNNPQTKKLIITVEVSFPINPDDINQKINISDNSFLWFSIDRPERYKVLYAKQINRIKREFRKVAEEHVVNYDEIHLFCAVPAGLAVEMGRTLLQSIWPKIYLYNYNSGATPRYQLAFTIN